jgi:ABC-type Fe3+ transport system substrate-binding protein
VIDMTRPRVALPVIALAAALAMVAAACGSSGGGAASTTGPPANNSTAGQTLKGQSIEVAAEWSGAEQKAFEQVIAAFQSQTGASVRYTSTGDNTATILGTRVKGGNPPNVALLPQPGLLAQFANQGALTQIDSFAGSTVSANYADIWKQLGSVDGKLYGVWFKAANKSTFWYNVPVFKNAGIQPPTTWPQLMSVAQTVKNYGVTPFAVGSGDGWPLTDWFENVYLRTAGPQMYDKLTQHQIPWTDPSVTTALTTLAQVWSHSDWILGGNRGSLQVSFTDSVNDTFANPPKAGMTYEGDFVEGLLPKGAKPQTDAAFFDFPSINNSPTSVVGGGDVAVLMKDTPAGEAFIKYLATPAAGEIWAKIGGFSSPNKNVPLADYPDPLTQASVKALTSAPNVRFDMSDLSPPAFGGTPGQGEWKILQDFMANPSNIQGTESALEAAAKRAYGS